MLQLDRKGKGPRTAKSTRNVLVSRKCEIVRHIFTPHVRTPSPVRYSATPARHSVPSPSLLSPHRVRHPISPSKRANGCPFAGPRHPGDCHHALGPDRERGRTRQQKGWRYRGAFRRERERRGQGKEEKHGNGRWGAEEEAEHAREWRRGGEGRGRRGCR